MMLNSKPFESKVDNIMNIIIEIAVSAYLYVQLSLTDFMGPFEHRETLGWILACIIVGVVSLNILVFTGSLFFSIVNLIKRRLLQQSTTRSP